MKEFRIRLSDRAQHGDITAFLANVLAECNQTGGEKLISFEKGEYHFYGDFAHKLTIYASNTDSYLYPEKLIGVHINGQKNLTFDGSGSSFVFHGKVVPFVVTDSERVTLKNFSWDFPVAGTLECEVINKGLFYTDFRLYEKCQWEKQGRKLFWFEKSPFSGKKYWENIGQNHSHCVVCHDREKNNVSRYPLTAGPFFGVRKISKLSENAVRIHYFFPASKAHRKGIIFEMCPNWRRDSVGSFFCDSKNIRVEDVSVHYMHGFGWLTQMCENVSFINCDFTPSEDGDRYCTSFADLIHVSGAKGKIHIEGCKFSNAHDDPINIHGTYTQVTKKTGEKTLKLEYKHNQQNGFVQYHKGDKVVFYLRKDFGSLQNEREFTVESVVNPLCEGNSVREMLVTFEEELPEELFEKNMYVCENITYTPEVYIGSCCFKKIPTRGILCTTRKATVIEKNVFDGMTMSSIYISNDCNDWYESGPVRDMIIRDNEFHISDCVSGMHPAIFIDPIVSQRDASGSLVHSGIKIKNNKIYLKDGQKAVVAKYCRNLVISDNIIYGSDGISPYETSDCEELIIDANEEK